jgi:hypothetical protein
MLQTKVGNVGMLPDVKQGYYPSSPKCHDSGFGIRDFDPIRDPELERGYPGQESECELVGVGDGCGIAS